MGHKVHPKSFRLGITTTWNSKWFADKNYATLLKEDTAIKQLLRKKLKEAGLAKLEIERTANALTIIIYTSRPGVVIGRAGAGVEELKREIVQRVLGGRKVNLSITIQEVDNPQLSAELMVRHVIEQIEKRIPCVRAMKQAVTQVERAGAMGVKIAVAGRLDGAEIARREQVARGKIPLATLRANIDYSRGTAFTTYGTIGVKAWIYSGEVFNKETGGEHARAA